MVNFPASGFLLSSRNVWNSISRASVLSPHLEIRGVAAGLGRKTNFVNCFFVSIHHSVFDFASVKVIPFTPDPWRGFERSSILSGGVYCQFSQEERKSSRGIPGLVARVSQAFKAPRRLAFCQDSSMWFSAVRANPLEWNSQKKISGRRSVARRE